MSQSSLVNKQVWANGSNYTVGRTDTIHGIVIHHAASTSLDSVGQVFSQYGRGASAHYGVGGSQIHQYVREEDTAWHCGDWPGNCCTIGIEVVNSTGAPTWQVSDESFATLVKLVADIAKRNNLGKIKFGPNDTYPTLSAHRDWSPTYCPGDYLYSKMNELADKVNELNYPSAQKAELTWTQFDEPVSYITTRNTHLYNFNKVTVGELEQIKNYNKDTVIPILGTVKNKTIGMTFLLTEYSMTNRFTNGFKSDAMKVVEKPAVTPSDEPKDQEPTVEPSEQEKPQEDAPVRPDGTGDTDNPRGLSEEEYNEVVENLCKIEEKGKESKAMIPMPSKVYDVLKIVAIVILPMIQVLYGGLAKIWGFGFGTEIDQTIQLVVAAINTLLGVALVKSSSDYHKGDIQ